MGRTLSLAHHRDEIRLASARTPGGALNRRLARLTRRAPSSAGTLRGADSGLQLRAAGPFEDGVEIPWREVRKLAIDDGSRWGYVSGVCRFPVYDLRQDGSGSGVLIGPLWSHAGSLMPDGCPSLEIDPVPGQAPNVALVLDPPLAVPASEQDGGAERQWVSIILLRAEDPEAARDALRARHTVADIGHEDLEYLMEAARRPGPKLSVSDHRASA